MLKKEGAVAPPGSYLLLLIHAFRPATISAEMLLIDIP
jgi:hypothetical protein